MESSVSPGLRKNINIACEFLIDSHVVWEQYFSHYIGENGAIKHLVSAYKAKQLFSLAQDFQPRSVERSLPFRSTLCLSRLNRRELWCVCTDRRILASLGVIVLARWFTAHVWTVSPGPEGALALGWGALSLSGAGMVQIRLGDVVPQGCILRSNKAPASLRAKRPQSMGGTQSVMAHQWSPKAQQWLYS